MTGLPDVLLEIAVLLAVAVIVGVFAQRLRLPLTLVLAVAGIAVVASGADLELSAALEGDGFEQLLVNLFLPVLIFAAALGLSTRELLRTLVAVLSLATVALAIAAVLVAFGLHALLGIPLAAALLFGVLSSATDPVAVVSTFEQLGVPKRLLTLVEGESLLNDGVAIVLSQVLLLLALGGSLSAGDVAVDFLAVFFGGAAIGAVIGGAAALVLPLLGRMPAAALSVAVAVGGFVLAESVLGFSGVMATVASGVVIGGMLPSRTQPEVRTLLHELWESLAFIANALLFLFVGLALDLGLLVDNLAAVGIAIGAVLVARPLAVLPVVWLVERTGALPRIGAASSAAVVWGGLRGGVALALALALPTELPQRELFIAMTGGVVLATLLLNATTISTLVRMLGLDQPSDEDRYLDAVARIIAVRTVRERLEDLGFADDLVDAHLDVAAADAHDQLDRSRLGPDEEVALLTLRGLHIEREAYQRLSDAHLLPPIATRTLMTEIEDEIEEARFGRLRIDAHRGAARPWHARLYRRVLGSLPPPLGEDLVDLAYLEVSARRLAAHRAAEELASFEGFDGVDAASVTRARELFVHWDAAATAMQHRLEAHDDIDRRVLRRRQSQAVGRIAAVAELRELADAGILPPDVAAAAGARVAAEIDEAR